MKFSTSVQTVIRERKSVRTYLDTPIEQEKEDLLIDLMDGLKTEEHRFKLIDFKFEESAKISTYGMVKGASAYIVGIMKINKGSDVQSSFRFGCDFEKIVLKATDLGLGTCWLAATFNSSDVEKLIDLESDEQIVMVSPLGYGAKPRGAERLTRFFAKSDSRKPWSDIFFNHDDTMPLTREETDGYAAVLDMVRLAPSASNSQPWRIIKRNNKYEFYSAASSIASKPNQKIDLSYNDLGIAKAHFELTAKELGLNGYFELIDGDMTGFGELTYIGSWTCE